MLLRTLCKQLHLCVDYLAAAASMEPTGLTMVSVSDYKVLFDVHTQDFNNSLEMLQLHV
jgi:hypothetical protein